MTSDPIVYSEALAALDAVLGPNPTAREENMGTPKTDPDYEHSEAALRDEDAFDEWMLAWSPKHQPTDDATETRLLRRCWAVSAARQREQIAKLCIERAQLTWVAADETPFDKDKMRLEAEASTLESMAAELRA